MANSRGRCHAGGTHLALLVPAGGSIGSRWGLRGALSEEVGWGELLKGWRV